MKDGIKIVVHNQWGSKFPNFIKTASKFYAIVDENGNEWPLIKEQYKQIGEDSGITITNESLMKFQGNK